MISSLVFWMLYGLYFLFASCIKLVIALMWSIINLILLACGVKVKNPWQVLFTKNNNKNIRTKKTKA